MPKPKPLAPKKLRATLAPHKVPYVSSQEIPDKVTGHQFQPRALMALETGLDIFDDHSFNVFVAGGANLGRTYLVEKFLDPHAEKLPTPDDLIYVYNFADADRPVLLRLPYGEGCRLKQALAKAITTLRRELPGLLTEEKFIKKREKRLQAFAQKQETIIQAMEKKAMDNGFELDLEGQNGPMLYPLLEGRVLSEEDYDRLEPELRKKLKKCSDTIMVQLNKMLRDMQQKEQHMQEKERAVEKDVLTKLLAQHVVPIVRDFSGHKELGPYLEALQKDILENMDKFLPTPEKEAQHSLGLMAEIGGGGEDFFVRYSISLFVDNSKACGAPVVLEDHPTIANLLGCVERESEMGALYTDFTLIKSGALHRAIGGFLVLRLEDIAQHPEAWDGLLRSLRSKKSRIEEPGEGQDYTRTKTIQPAPVPLQVRVVLVGTDMAYESLLQADDRFAKLFKLKAHIQDAVARTASSIKHYLHVLGHIIRSSNLYPFDREALAGLVDHGSHMAGDKKRLSLEFPLLREVMVEASSLARKEKQKFVSKDILNRTLYRRLFRANLYEEEFLADYDRSLIKVATEGQAVGRSNGLAVIMYGYHEFGLAHEIACNVGVGHGGVIDLEREAEMGGPIHTKGMMILKSYLLRLFAQNKPLVFTGSLAFEQSYAGVEGDSASGAELAALLSALARTPIDLSLAFTGAVNQSGHIMAVGGVSPKIEGFFKVCKRRGLTGKQGVIIPKDNIDHLMLSDEVCSAVEKGEFAIYPVSNIEQAMELLTGLPTGKCRTDCTFAKGTLYRLVDDRLAELANLAHKEGK